MSADCGGRWRVGVNQTDAGRGQKTESSGIAAAMIGSNVLWREQDHDVIRNEQVDVEKVMPGIVASLPRCKCGGQFTLDAGPKCPRCGYEFKQQIANLELRATEPHAILIEG